MNEIIGTRMITARMQLQQQEQLLRDIALHKLERRTERNKNRKIAVSMIMLLALIIANAWAFRQGWGL
jgi:flagellar biogenesis protein FliO